MGSDFLSRRRVCNRRIATVVLAALAESYAQRLQAGTIYESGFFDTTSSTNGYPTNSDTFVGVRFQLTTALTADRIGASVFGGGQIFGALVQLTGLTDFPDSANLSTPDVLRTALIIASGPSSDSVAGFTPISLSAGWYGLVFGSALFGANGVGFATSNNVVNGTPNYLSRNEVGDWGNGASAGSRLFLMGAVPRLWASTNSGDWSTGSNWIGGVVPDGFDDAIFDQGGTYTTTLGINRSVHIVNNKRDNVTMSLGGARTLTLTGDFLVGGTVALGPATTNLQNGTFTFTSTNGISVGDLSSGTLNLSGSTINNSYGSIIVGRKAAGTLNVGTSTINSLHTLIADDPALSTGVLGSGTGAVALNSGTTWNAQRFFIGRSGAGTVDLNTGATLNTSLQTRVFATSGTLLRLQGGTLKTAQFSVDSASRFSWTSGKLWITTSDLSIQNGGAVGPSLTLNPGMTLQTDASVVLPSSGGPAFIVAGGTWLGANIANNGEFSQTSGASSAKLFDNTVAGIGTAAVTGGTLSVDRIRQQGLVLGGQGKLTIRQSGGSNTFTSRTTTLMFSGSGKIDLKDNKLIVAEGGGGGLGTLSAGAYTGITGQVQKGLNNGDWLGTGLVTSMSAALQKRTTLAAVRASEAFSIGDTQTRVWGSQTIVGSDTLVMYTWAGDLNVDGTINADDYAYIDLYSKIAGSSGYMHGDINYDGVINADDYALIDVNVMNQGNPFPARAPLSESGKTAPLSAVPEPTVGALGIAFHLLLHRRRTKAR
jgi:hypothetical protein